MSEWKHDITRLFYLLNRKEKGDMSKLTSLFEYWVRKSFETQDHDLYDFLLRMILHTRDPFYGKGEQSISYMMIVAFYAYYPEATLSLLHSFVYPVPKPGGCGGYMPPYGCWRDMKHICSWVKKANPLLSVDQLPLVKEIIQIMNNQLYKDTVALDRPSLVAKWIPREKSAHGWLFYELAKQWAKKHRSYLFFSATSHNEMRRNCLCYAEYRKILSKLNRLLDTVEIKQCSHDWKNINPENINIGTLIKQKRAFFSDKTPDRMECWNRMQHFFIFSFYEPLPDPQNHDEQILHDFYNSDNKQTSTQNGLEQNRHSEFREAHLETCEDEVSNLKNKHFSLSKKLILRFRNKRRKPADDFLDELPVTDLYPNSNGVLYSNFRWYKIQISFFVKEALALLYSVDESVNHPPTLEFFISKLNKTYFLELFWIHYKNHFGVLENIIPIVDISLSMNESNMMPYYNALGLGILLANQSSFKNRFITVDHQPSWINLDDCSNFVSMIEKTIESSKGGTRADLFESIQFIIQSILVTNMSPLQVGKLVFVVLSDMKLMNSATHAKMVTLFHDAGIKSIYKTPFIVPHIVYWNVGNSFLDDLPSLCNEPRVSILSGSSPSLIRDFCFQGSNPLLKDYAVLHPYHILHDVLGQSRYTSLFSKKMKR
jgi:hypothetical protein